MCLQIVQEMYFSRDYSKGDSKFHKLFQFQTFHHNVHSQSVTKWNYSYQNYVSGDLQRIDLNLELGKLTLSAWKLSHTSAVETCLKLSAFVLNLLYVMFYGISLPFSKTQCFAIFYSIIFGSIFCSHVAVEKTALLERFIRKFSFSSL